MILPCAARPVCADRRSVQNWLTSPEATPVLEAANLQDDLRRAGIEPWGWIINASLAAARTNHPLLHQRAASELPQIARVRDDLSLRYAVVPMQAEDPVGADHLIALCRGLTEPETKGRQRVAI